MRRGCYAMGASCLMVATTIGCAGAPTDASEPGGVAVQAASLTQGVTTAPRRNARPLRLPGSPLLTHPAQCAVGLSYYGGRVASNAQVVVVYWTSAVDPTAKNYLSGFFTAITNSSYFDLMGEYGTVGL